MMLAGQIGGLQRSLTSPDLHAAEKATLTDRLTQLQLSLHDIDQEIVKLTAGIVFAMIY